MELDALDRALLRELQNDARQTNRDLAAKTGVSPSTSLERVRLLREHGIITGYHAALDLEAAYRSVQALISVRIRPLNPPGHRGIPRMGGPTAGDHRPVRHLRRLRLPHPHRRSRRQRGVRLRHRPPHRAPRGGGCTDHHGLRARPVPLHRTRRRRSPPHHRTQATLITAAAHARHHHGLDAAPSSTTTTTTISGAWARRSCPVLRGVLALAYDLRRRETARPWRCREGCHRRGSRRTPGSAAWVW